MSSDFLLAQSSSYGEIEEGPLGLDEQTGKFKGYSLFVFKTVEAAQAALVEPVKTIDGSIMQCKLAMDEETLVLPAADVFLGKIYVGNVPPEMSSDFLLAQSSSYGEIEEGPLGLDEQTGKFKGYSLFVFKTVEAAQAALVEPVKTIDGSILQCKLAMDEERGGIGGTKEKKKENKKKRRSGHFLEPRLGFWTEQKKGRCRSPPDLSPAAA
ncbi:hypothetical protein KSP40_PGU010625 [Platanthera guangdongensis]|uniref:RRM domain-containing protein n=1 Tax=Platanthera guangdongensis TaxID=2320717 RepID=A0ABR2MN61_9ASPA